MPLVFLGKSREKLAILAVKARSHVKTIFFSLCRGPELNVFTRTSLHILFYCLQVL